MAMLRLLAREREGVTLVPPIVVRDELELAFLLNIAGFEVTETFYALPPASRKMQFYHYVSLAICASRS